jgi:dihydrofolate reductase
MTRGSKLSVLRSKTLRLNLREAAPMRKLIFAINLTLDGCCDHTKSTGSEDIHEYFTDLMRDADLLIYGRKTYQLMVPFWPDVAKSQSMDKVANEFARTFDSIRKLVFSRSLDTAEENTTILRTNIKDEILKLKKQQGKNMLLGGVDLASQIIELGLVDEYRVVIHPVIVGQGRRLLEGISVKEKLQLLDSKPLKSGCVTLHYSKL